MLPTPYETPTLTEPPWDVVCEAPPGPVEDALELLAVVSLLEASVHPSELHTKFHVLGWGELLLPAVPATVPARVVVPSAESLPSVEAWLDAMIEDTISVVEACVAPDEGESEAPELVWSLPGVEPWAETVFDDAIALDEGESEALDSVWVACCDDGDDVEEAVFGMPVSPVDGSPLLPLAELRAGGEFSTLLASTV
jgi:hypothetical protein